MMGNYILDEKGNPQKCDDLITWAKWMATAERHVGDDTKDGIHVSTVFLGLDYSFSGGSPILYETMVFGGPDDQLCERYRTRAEAVLGHGKICRKVFTRKDDNGGSESSSSSGTT